MLQIAEAENLGETDYFYEESDGCCLNCPDAEEGCLCVLCKCRKCAAYDREDKCLHARLFERKGDYDRDLFEMCRYLRWNHAEAKKNEYVFLLRPLLQQRDIGWMKFVRDHPEVDRKLRRMH